MILREQITRLRPATVSDGYGNTKPDWSNVTSTPFAVKWSHKSVSEVVGDEAKTATRGYVFGNPDLDLAADDRVIGPDGLTYEVDGQPMRSYVRGQLHHIRAYLRRIEISAS